MSDPSLAEIAAELYAMPPEEFIAARNERAKSVGDAALARDVRALRKPTVSAWVVNVFAQERADRLAEALQLADELREAQADLDAQTLAALGRQRRALTNRLADESAALATARGGRVTAATRENVHQTITAAFFDSRAAEAVASGRLVRELEPSGETAFDPDSAVGGGTPERRDPPEPPADELRARRERRDAERTLHAAEEALARVERERAAVDRERREAGERAESLAERIRELEEDLARLRERASAARREADALDERAEHTAEGVHAAKKAVSDAQEILERLDRP